ncbi:hypothetical protein Lsan_2161 [Legionella santicrucis]|uniref:Uncharacterized protein n=1 Tax=Legionella santicrucis TaxID=45074 RepID=A0A0W0YRR6_9GAMM|nr:hypothetical protein Lsan_2161 [Legionella santicrucis]
MHVVDVYTSSEHFGYNFVPTFTKRPKSSRQVYNWTTNQREDWFDSKLGVNFAVFKSMSSAAAPSSASALYLTSDQAFNLDLAGVKELYKVRTKILSISNHNLKNLLLWIVIIKLLRFFEYLSGLKHGMQTMGLIINRI